MKGFDVIKCLCAMGNTEGIGLTDTSPENIDDIPKWLGEWFGIDEESTINGTIEPNEDYLYSYEDSLWGIDVNHPPIPDATITLGDMNIYLYKIE